MKGDAAAGVADDISSPSLAIAVTINVGGGSPRPPPKKDILSVGVYITTKNHFFLLFIKHTASPPMRQRDSAELEIRLLLVAALASLTSCLLIFLLPWSSLQSFCTVPCTRYFQKRRYCTLYCMSISMFYMRACRSFPLSVDVNDVGRCKTLPTAFCSLKCSTLGRTYALFTYKKPFVFLDDTFHKKQRKEKESFLPDALVSPTLFLRLTKTKKKKREDSQIQKNVFPEIQNAAVGTKCRRGYHCLLPIL